MSRWLVLVASSACSLSRPTLATDAGTPGSDGTPADSEVDADTSGGFYRDLIIADDAVTGGPHANFPVLVALTGDWVRSIANGGTIAREDAFDVHFADSSGPLDHEIEVYDPVGGALLAWVRIPTLVNGTMFRVEYGDLASTTSTEDAPGVWSAGYRLVLHADTLDDATGQNATITASTGGYPGGRIAAAVRLDGVSHAINAMSASAIDNVFATGGTVEAWVFADSFGANGYGRIADKSSWLLYVAATNPTNTIVFVHASNNASFGQWQAPNNSMSLGQWHHVAVTLNKSLASTPPAIYVNGQPVSVVQQVAPSGAFDTDASSALYLGNRQDGDRGFDGLLDEVRLSTVARSPGWIATQYRNHDVPSSFVAVGQPVLR